MLRHLHHLIHCPRYYSTALVSIFLVIFLFIPTNIYAKPTTPKQAQRLVNNWLKQNRNPLGTHLGQQVTQVQSFRNISGQIVYYTIYLEPQGVVIVPADDLVEPIVAFAPLGQFDPAEDNPLKAIVTRDIPYRIQQVREAERQAEFLGKTFSPKGGQEQARRKWETLTQRLPKSVEKAPLLAVSDLRVAPMVQSRWYQTYVSGVYCYNYYTPNHYASGCVATALAQVLRYHRFPTAALGTLSFSIQVDGSFITSQLRGGDGYGGPYDWDNMALVPDAYVTELQRQAIGALTYDAGVACHMQYSANGSGAYVSDAREALINTFGYSNAVINETSSSFTLNSTIPMINPNLDAGFPVYLGIRNSSSGHAVLADGYGFDTTTLYHHLNLGWAGRGDAWYNLPTVDTGSTVFTIFDDCIYNIFPTGTGEIISGRITNARGTPIAGATITATSAGGSSYIVTSNSSGIYALAKIPASSTYTIQAAKTGINFSPPKTISVGSSISYPSNPGNRWGVDFSGTPAGGYLPAIIELLLRD